MSFELRIGWRYLYRGHWSRQTTMGLIGSLLVTAAGLYLVITANGSSPAGVVSLVVGMLSATLFALLGFFSVFTAVSVLGVVLGVAALTVVLAVTTGFQQQFREKVLGVNAHVIVMKNTPDFGEYRDVEQAALAVDPDVVAVQPFIFVEMQVTRGMGELSGGGVAVKGVDPERVTQVLDLQKHMIEGSVDSLGVEPAEGQAPPIIMGKELARKLKAEVGDELTLVVPLSNMDFETWTARGSAPLTREFRVAGIFYSGFDEYDRRMMYIDIKEAQSLLKQGDRVMGVELKVKNVERASEIANRLEAALDNPSYVVQDWRELNRNLFTALLLQKLVLLIIMTLIIIVATFNMVSALTMMVIDKTREIAILKSMGATSGSIAWLFQIVGLCIGGVGSAVGLATGLAICKVVGSYGYRLDPKVYLIDRLPIAVDAWEMAFVALITMLISAVATLFPSAKASRLSPVEGLRYD